MKQYILLLFALTAALYSTAQNNNQQAQTALQTPASDLHTYEIVNNGEVIKITDKTLGQTYTYSAYDTLHYAMIRKIRTEQEAARKQQPADRQKKREEIVR